MKVESLLQQNQLVFAESFQIDPAGFSQREAANVVATFGEDCWALIKS